MLVRLEMQSQGQGLKIQTLSIVVIASYLLLLPNLASQN